MKKLILFLLLVLIPFSLVNAQDDTSKTFIYSTTQIAIPAFDIAGQQNYNLGFNIGIDKKLDSRLTMGVAYNKLRTEGENDDPDIKADFTALKISYWLYNFGEPNNVCINFSPGYSKIINGSSAEEQLALACGMGLMIHLFKDVHLRFNYGIGKYGNLKDEGAAVDAFNFDLGLSFKWD